MHRLCRHWCGDSAANVLERDVFHRGALFFLARHARHADERRRAERDDGAGDTGQRRRAYTPYAAQLVGQSNDLKIEMLMRGGWVSARQSTAGVTGAVATATDTVTSGTITYLGLRGLQPFASLELNLPTGLAALTAAQVNARMDPDLVDISTFGEGLNIGPTVGVNIPLGEAWLLTMSAGYTAGAPTLWKALSRRHSPAARNRPISSRAMRSRSRRCWGIKRARSQPK